MSEQDSFNRQVVVAARRVTKAAGMENMPLLEAMDELASMLESNVSSLDDLAEKLDPTLLEHIQD